MKVGDLVKEKYVTDRVGIIVAIIKEAGFYGTTIKVEYANGENETAPAFHFWEVNDECG